MHARILQLGCVRQMSVCMQEAIRLHRQMHDFPALLSFLGPMQPDKPTMLQQHLVGKMVHAVVRPSWA